jgi:hypothetical protein
MYADRYVPNKTTSVPDDVVPIIESSEVPFSRWVAKLGQTRDLLQDLAAEAVGR